MRTLHRKLLRDLMALKGQAAAIAVVIAGGVMTLIIAVTSLDALTMSKERFYAESRFAEVFVTLERAPERVSDRLRALSGVDRLETRVEAPVRVEVPEFADPIQGRAISIPDGHQPELNQLHIREGTLPERGRGEQILISEPFAQAHGLRAGDRIHAIIRGRMERLEISGIALSPEWIYQIGPADLLPDYERFAVIWMNRQALAGAFDMDGAFNSVVLTLQPGVREASVIEALDELLAPYGSLGAHGRDEQQSHSFLMEEIEGLRVLAAFLPTVFLAVSAFLLHVLVGRIIRTQRQQIAVLKAFGYSNADMAVHYGLLTGFIVLLGSAVGVGLGAWAASALAELFAEYFRFPEMAFRLQPQVVLLGVVVAGAAALLGAFHAVYGAVTLAPAQAMRPPAPETFRQGWLEHAGLQRWLSQPGRMILRNVARHRFKATLSVVGIALSAGLILVTGYMFSAFDELIDRQYRLVQKADVVVHLTEPSAAHAVAGLRQQPGVQYVEPFRAVPVRLRHERLTYRTAIEGLDPGLHLRGLIDGQGRDIELPPEGLLLTDYLADDLGVSAGDRVRVEVMEQHQRSVDVEVAAVVGEPIGVSAYMQRDALNRLMREGPTITGARLLVDAAEEDALFTALRNTPRVAGVGLIAETEAQIRAYIEDTVLAFMAVLTVLAASIAFAVVYNNARIAFAERVRELATLRVLGFTRGEVGWILIGEILLLTLLAIPLGWIIGTGLAWLLNQVYTLEMLRMPFVIPHQTYASAAAGVGVATALSLLLIVRRLRRIDMVSALKTVE